MSDKTCNRPCREQHAAHERNRRGNPVCPGLGAAVDFMVQDEDMLEVARWVATDSPFDRLCCRGPVTGPLWVR